MLRCLEHLLAFDNKTFTDVDSEICFQYFIRMLFHIQYCLHFERSAFVGWCNTFSSSSCSLPLLTLCKHHSSPKQSSVPSSSSHHLAVPRIRLPTVGKRAFPVSGATVWNDLPPRVTSAPSLATFRQRLKSFLFSQSYSDIHTWLIEPSSLWT